MFLNINILKLAQLSTSCSYTALAQWSNVMYTRLPVVSLTPALHRQSLFDIASQLVDLQLLGAMVQVQALYE